MSKETFRRVKRISGEDIKEILSTLETLDIYIGGFIVNSHHYFSFPGLLIIITCVVADP